MELIALIVIAGLAWLWCWFKCVSMTEEDVPQDVWKR